MLSRHSELEQSETKAQAALVTILSLTQITELKLLLDIGRHGHRFYDFVLAMLIGCISLEIFIGVIIIYIGNLHYYQTSERGGLCYQILSCLACCGGGGGGGAGSGQATYGRSPPGAKRSSYLGGREHIRLSTRPPESSGVLQEDVEFGVECCRGESRLETLLDLERVDCNIELARIKVADAAVKIARAANYIKVVEEATKKTPGSAEMDEELGRAREEHVSAVREREEAEAELRLAEAHQSHAFFVKEQEEDRQERVTFRKVSFWQHVVTYLLYFVMLLNVFITTFGISAGVGGVGGQVQGPSSLAAAAAAVSHDIGNDAGGSSSSSHGVIPVATNHHNFSSTNYH